MKKVVVVGGGAAGLMAAIAAAKQGAKVTLLEKNKQVGKKILVTGNGRCNLTNRDQSPDHYRSAESDFAAQVLSRVGMQDILKKFTEFGIFTKNRNGYLYPYSDQAASVAEVLRLEAEHRGVKLALNTEAQAITREENSFRVQTEGWSYPADAVILTCGSKAAPETGSDGGGYRLAESLGHRIIKPLPALVQLRCKEKFYEKLAGVRMDARVELYTEERLLASDQGEVQFTKNGISGIPVFQVSRYAVRALDAGKKVRAVLNLMPMFDEAQFLTFLKDRAEKNPYKTGEQFLTGLFPAKTSACVLERSGLGKSGKKAGDWTDAEFAKLTRTVTQFETEITGSGDFTQAQVCSGGADTREVNPDTMESRKVPGLYLAGELLDVDGACGGYNLQWAWSSGWLAGVSAASAGEEEMYDSNQSNQTSGGAWRAGASAGGGPGTEGGFREDREADHSEEIHRREKETNLLCIYGGCEAEGRGKASEEASQPKCIKDREKEVPFSGARK